MNGNTEATDPLFFFLFEPDEAPNPGIQNVKLPPQRSVRFQVVLAMDIVLDRQDDMISRTNAFSDDSTA